MRPNCEQATDIAGIRSLARSFSGAELNGCLADALNNKKNQCVECMVHLQAVDLLSRAVYVKTLVEEQGATINEAVRDLGSRMRRFQQMAK